MKVVALSGFMVLALLGCAGTGEKIAVAIPGKFTGAPGASSGGPRVAVLPFEDKRPKAGPLGERAHFWGGTSTFELPSGNVSTATAQALVEYLNRQGWRASVVRTTAGTDGAEVTIGGAVTELSLNAKSGWFHTDIAAKNSLAFQITNHSDESVVRERVDGSATDQVFWFDPEDAQALLTDVLESNFRKLLNDVRVDGRAIRLK